MLAADMSLFHICPRDASLRLKDEELVYAAHQAVDYAGRTLISTTFTSLRVEQVRAYMGGTRAFRPG